MYLLLLFRADAARQKSEALRNLATQLIEEHKDYTKKNELDAEYRLEERNKDVGFWKQELEEEVEAMRKEVELLTEPVQQWTDLGGHNMLQKLYEDPKKYNFQFQSYVLLTRYRVFKKKLGTVGCRVILLM